MIHLAHIHFTRRNFFFLKMMRTSFSTMHKQSELTWAFWREFRSLPELRPSAMSVSLYKSQKWLSKYNQTYSHTALTISARSFIPRFPLNTRAMIPPKMKCMTAIKGIQQPENQLGLHVHCRNLHPQLSIEQLKTIAIVLNNEEGVVQRRYEEARQRFPDDVDDDSERGDGPARIRSRWMTC